MLPKFSLSSWMGSPDTWEDCIGCHDTCDKLYWLSRHLGQAAAISGDRKITENAEHFKDPLGQNAVNILVGIIQHVCDRFAYGL